MPWKCYKLIYKALSPIHIGYHTLGFIQRTRTYIPGKNVWAAITEKLTRELWSDVQSEQKPHENVGEKVAVSILPAYFYPAVVVEGMKPLFPSFNRRYPGVPLGIESLLTCSHGETAIDPSRLGAEEGSLHETEYIANKVEGKDVYFTGYLFLKGEARVNQKEMGWDEGQIILKDLLKEIHVGGNRRYGFGRLFLEDSKESKDIFSFYSLDLTDEWPVVTNINKDVLLLAHLEAEKARYIEGDVEPLVGREWEPTKGPGQKLSKAKICWMPGSVVKNVQTFKIGEYGIWKA